MYLFFRNAVSDFLGKPDSAEEATKRLIFEMDPPEKEPVDAEPAAKKQLLG